MADAAALLTRDGLLRDKNKNSMQMERWTNKQEGPIENLLICTKAWRYGKMCLVDEAMIKSDVNRTGAGQLEA